MVELFIWVVVMLAIYHWDGFNSVENHDISIRVLTDVQYVPKLKKNLISLRALESKGFVKIIRDEILFQLLYISHICQNSN